MKQYVSLLLIIYTINSYSQDILLPKKTVELCIECIDVVKKKNEIISYKDSTILIKDERIKTDSLIIETYKSDSITNQNKSNAYIKIIENKNEQLDLVKKEFRKVKRERTLERVLSGVIIVVVILIAI